MTEKGIRYWEIIPEVFSYSSDDIHTPCPFKGSWYQWMRNMTLCREIAKEFEKKPAFILVYADSSVLPFTKKVKTGDWKKFEKKIIRDQITFDTISYQEISQIACEESTLEQDKFNKLNDWIQNKIGRVSSRIGAR